MTFKAIAIDGPAGAGKSVIAKTIANMLNYIYMDTGALYRGIALCVRRSGKDTTDKRAVEELLPNIKIGLEYIDGKQRVILNGEDISEEIRTAQVAMEASSVSSMPCVRKFLLELQRSFAKTNNIIMDGRDIGTVILPNADVKIFLTASAEVRAKRRYAEHVSKGEAIDFDLLYAEIVKRDNIDYTKAISPLKQAEDAILVDTSNLTLEQSIETIAEIIGKKINS